MQVKAHAGAKVLATTTLPWPAPDASKFSSIHSNPPWQPTDRPEIVSNDFGRGRAVYASSGIENVDGMRDVCVALVRMLAGEMRFEADAPATVEMTVFHQPDRHRYLLSLVNFQQDLPNVPVEGITVRMRPRKLALRRVVRLPDAHVIEHHESDGVVTFPAGHLETLAVYALETM